MADMRATERIVEVIAEDAALIGRSIAGAEMNVEAMQKAARAIGLAANELRRRGDTLVRHGDLRLIAAALNDGPKFASGARLDDAALGAALSRIENAVGGSL